MQLYAKIDAADLDVEELSNRFAEILPESVRTLLSKLPLLPCRELLGIEFLPHLYEIMFPRAGGESEVEFGAAEERKIWRALMASVYRTLSKNEEIYAKRSRTDERFVQNEAQRSTFLVILSSQG